MFRVGQKVVCVWRKPNMKWPGTLPTVVGAIYTVRGIEWISAPYSEGHPGLYLEELRNEVRMTTEGMWEPSYRASKFRPVVERSTDITFAHEILRKATKRQRAPV